MSANTSAGRVFYGVQSDNYGISRPAQSQSVDLRGMTRTKRGQAVAAGGNTRPTGIAGLGNIDAIINSARGPARQQQQNNQQHPSEQARQQHQQATLDSYTQAAEDTSATGPTGRHAYVLPRTGEAVTATPNTRNFPQYPDADGPLGSTGLPSGPSFTGGFGAY